MQGVKGYPRPRKAKTILDTLLYASGFKIPIRPPGPNEIPDEVTSIAVSNHGNIIAVGSIYIRPGVQLWNISTGKLFTVLDLPVTDAIAFSPEDDRIACGGRNGFIGVWDISSGRNLWTPHCTSITWNRYDERVTCISFSNGGFRIASGSEDGFVRIWCTVTGEQKQQMAWFPEKVLAVSFVKNDTRVVSVASLGIIREFDVLDSTRPAREIRFDVKPGFLLKFAAFSSDATLAVCGFEGHEGRVAVLDVTTWRVLRILLTHIRCITAIAFRKDNLRVVFGTFRFGYKSDREEGMVFLWQLQVAESDDKVTLSWNVASDEKQFLSPGQESLSHGKYINSCAPNEYTRTLGKRRPPGLAWIFRITDWLQHKRVGVVGVLFRFSSL